jgi:hypothetical protein
MQSSPLPDLAGIARPGPSPPRSEAPSLRRGLSFLHRQLGDVHATGAVIAYATESVRRWRMVDSLYIEACCRLNERFPRLHLLWLLFWRIAIVCALRYEPRPPHSAPVAHGRGACAMMRS